MITVDLFAVPHNSSRTPLLTGSDKLAKPGPQHTSFGDYLLLDSSLSLRASRTLTGPGKLCSEG